MSPIVHNIKAVQSDNVLMVLLRADVVLLGMLLRIFHEKAIMTIIIMIIFPIVCKSSESEEIEVHLEMRNSENINRNRSTVGNLFEKRTKNPLNFCSHNCIVIFPSMKVSGCWEETQISSTKLFWLMYFFKSQKAKRKYILVN